MRRSFDCGPRFSLIERRRTSVSLPFSPFINEHHSAITPYERLPSHVSIKLQIIKLDGSSFDVHIRRNATVGELKQAVEDVFTLSSSSMGNRGLISWSHVWGHFCLSFENQKLLNDKGTLESFLIRDGDQLHFLRHLSTNFNRIQKSKSLSASKKNISRSTFLEPGICEEEKEDTGWVDVISDAAEANDKDDCTEDNIEKEMIKPPAEFKLSNIFKGWLWNSRSCFAGNSRSRHTGRYSRMSRKFLKMEPRIQRARV
ncbi:hypothetical protein C5167_019510 [Papaver somniferum]|uniref:Ubiquitin-like domain-containing protein n=1 Tax=Papaver somniferum TaxID=3469 RepID=A0A4Y7ITH2_PAPSO|nr:uncharacterized protein LOC113348973 isoform X1 [Papaver somniferum]RZC51090.1 hypothetical protein C5167_019510 [Papaver somniferum]